MKQGKKPETLESDESEDSEEGEIGDANRSVNTEPRLRHPFLAEDNGVVDDDDANLSDLFASMGVEERLDELGL